MHNHCFFVPKVSCHVILIHQFLKQYSSEHSLQQNSLVKRSNLFPQFLHSTYMIKISLQKWSLIQKWSTKAAFCRNVKITFCVPLSWEIKVTDSSNFRLRTFIIFILMKNWTFNTVLVLNNMNHSSKIAGQRKIPLCQDCQSGSYHQHCELVE